MKITPKRNGLAAYLRSHEHPGGIVVCEQPKFLYMKPGKTAGTSILRMGLEKRLPGIFHYKDHPEQFEDWINRITDEDLQKYFIFSVVRNPWDRLVSVAAYSKVPFEEFINNFDEYLKDYRIRMHSLPLSIYTHCNEEPFVDFFCRFECLQPDMNLVFDRLGLERENLSFVNRSKHKHYSLCYTDTAKQLVESIYRKDIEYFGYTFEPKNVRDKGIVFRITHKMFKSLPINPQQKLSTKLAK